MLKVSKLKKNYGKFTAVRSMSFEVNSGEIVAIVGPNGAGKTTTLKMICSLLKPDKGTIEFGDLDYEKDSEQIKKKIGYVPEESAIYDDMTANEYLLFFAELYGIPKKDAKVRIKRLLETLNLEYVDRPLGNMSKGMKRKVLIVRSLINDPEILIYDEPASGLDPQTTHFILNYILDLKKQNKTIIFTAHNLHQVEYVCDRIIMINKGRKIMDDTLKNIKKVFGGPSYTIKYDSGKTVKDKTFTSLAKLSKFIKKLSDDKKNLLDLKMHEESFEEIFLEIAKKNK